MPRTMTGTTAEVTLHIAAVPAPELTVASSVTARSKVAGTAGRERLQKSPPPPPVTENDTGTVLDWRF